MWLAAQIEFYCSYCRLIQRDIIGKIKIYGKIFHAALSSLQHEWEKFTMTRESCVILTSVSGLGRLLAKFYSF